jgi:hypothetical protein
MLSPALPALATPPPPPNRPLIDSMAAMDRFKPFLGDWILHESYIAPDGIRTNNKLELKVSRLDYVVTISVMYNGNLDQFYTIKYSPNEKIYRVFLCGSAYMGAGPEYDVVNLKMEGDRISWSRPGMSGGNLDQYQSLVYSLSLVDGKLIETEEGPSWPRPERIKRVYTFNKM